MDQEVLRILDANLNRAAEGIRVLEDFARMILNDSRLASELKEIRHRVGLTCSDLDGGTVGMVLARDSAGDVLREGETESERTRADLASVIRANARRACEAVRCLEEYGKLALPGVSERFKEIRFSLYDLEKILIERAVRHGEERSGGTSLD
jgi:hypothetical protein